MQAKHAEHSVAQRSDALRTLARALYEALTGGHERLPFAVDERGPAFTEVVGKNGERRMIPWFEVERGPIPHWRRAKEIRECVVVDRPLTPGVMLRHLRGDYSVAVTSAGWVQWAALDIDAHRRRGESEIAARARALSVVRRVWRALGCTAARHPIVLRSPGGGYHLWFPLTRGPNSLLEEHTWPALHVRGWLERTLRARGLRIEDGELEVWPCARPLRAPCAVRTELLQPITGDDPDKLTFRAWPGTSVTRLKWDAVDPRWPSELDGDMYRTTRLVASTAQTFLDLWEAQRRTLADWLGEPQAEWHPTWGPLLWTDEWVGEGRDKPEIVPAKVVQPIASQQQDEVPPGGPAGSSGSGAGRMALARGGKARSFSPKEFDPLSAPKPYPPESFATSGKLVYGAAFFDKVERLLKQGVVEPASRHDAVLVLAFYWGATCGLSDEEVLRRLEAWCRLHVHAGSRLSASPRRLVAECRAEARQYLERHGPSWPFRGRGHGGGLAALGEADMRVVAAANERVRAEVWTLLAWFGGRADTQGRVTDPVELTTSLQIRLCGDRRIREGGERRRATTLAIEELVRLGVLTMAANYHVGRRGKVWNCWYQFGSGVLPRNVAVSAAEWARLDKDAVTGVPSVLAVVPAPTPERTEVVARVVAERPLPKLGLLHVLSDVATGESRTRLVLLPEFAPTDPAARPVWYQRAFLRAFTVGEFWDPALGIASAFPSVEMRRNMTRSQRLRLGDAEARPACEPPVAGDMASPPVPISSKRVDGRLAETGPPAQPSAEPGQPTPTPPEPCQMDPSHAEAPAVDARAELERVAGAAARAVPDDLVESVGAAWEAFEARSRGRE